jgi:hypothetical protein
MDSPCRHEDYPEPPPGELPWLDRPDALDAIARRQAAGELTAEQAERCRTWVEKGYLVLPDLLDAATCDEINADAQAVHDENRHLPPAQLKLEFQDMWPRSPATVRALTHPVLYAWMDLLLGRRALPYQTLNLPVSSQQRPHSDAVLMTTNPPGFLIAAWIALEDVREDAGPLGLLPGSHRLPYVSAARIGVPRGASYEAANEAFDASYYGAVDELVAERGIEPVPFLAQRGDALLWHSNLLHGGYPITRGDATRRSLIVHYFGEGVEAYSDLYQKPCVLPGLRA